MKKAMLVILAMLVCSLSFSMNSWAIKDSTSLGAEDDLSSNIDKETGGIPIGSITAWPFSTLPSGGDWLECDGRTISATDYPEYVKQFGNKLPDYRGVFLRSRGGNAGALGVLQAESVNVPKSAGIKMHMDGIAKGEYSYEGVAGTGKSCYDTDTEGGGTVCNSYSTGVATKYIPFRTDEKLRYDSFDSWTGNSSYGTRNNAMNAIGVSSKGMDIPIQITSPYNETRPNNKAVVYIVRVR